MTQKPIRGMSHFQAGQIHQALEELKGLMDLTPTELALLGRCELRSHLLEDAELHLLRAQLLGVPEAGLDYAALLSITGRPVQALHHLGQCLNNMSGIMIYRAWHHQAQVNLQLGHTETAFEQAERASHSLLSINAEEEAGEALVTTAMAHALVGQADRAEKMFRIALTVLEPMPDPVWRFTALLGLAELKASRGQGAEYQEFMEQALRLAETAPSQASMGRWHCVAHKWSELGDHFLTVTLPECTKLAAFCGEYLLQDQSTRLNAKQAALDGHHAEALLILGRLNDRLSGESLLLIGEVAWRRGDYAGAKTALVAAFDWFSRARWTLHEFQTHALLADVCEALGDTEGVRTHVQHTVAALLTTPYVHAAGKSIPDRWQQWRDDDHFQPWIEAWNLRSKPTLIRSRLQITTLGLQEVRRGPNQPSLPLNIPLLVVLALHPNRTRRELELALYPDRKPGAATSAVKHGLQEIRSQLGVDVLVTEGAYHSKRYRLSETLQVQMDIGTLRQALKQRNISGALEIYRGEFLPNHHEGEWVEVMREELSSTLRASLVNRLIHYKSLGQWERVKSIAIKYLRVSPGDREVADLALEASKYLGDPLILAKQFLSL